MVEEFFNSISIPLYIGLFLLCSYIFCLKFLSKDKDGKSRKFSFNNYENLISFILVFLFLFIFFFSFYFLYFFILQNFSLLLSGINIFDTLIYVLTLSPIIIFFMIIFSKKGDFILNNLYIVTFFSMSFFSIVSLFFLIDFKDFSSFIVILIISSLSMFLVFLIQKSFIENRMVNLNKTELPQKRKAKEIFLAAIVTLIFLVIFIILLFPQNHCNQPINNNFIFSNGE